MGVKGEIEKVSPLFKAQNRTVYWHLVKLKDRPEEFALHQNFFGFYGDLKAGDKVEFELSKAKLGKDGSQGVNKKGYLLFDKLRKIETEKPLEEKRAEKWRKSR